MFIILMVFLIFAYENNIVAQVVKCPKEDVKFEKVIGLRPPNVSALLLFRDPEGRPVTLQCLRKCNDIDECQGFILNYGNQTCYWYRERVYASEEYDSIRDSKVAWFMKTCLKVNNCSKQWIYERAPGAILVGSDVKRIPYVVTRQQCQQLCLNETSFECRSSNYLVGHPNNTDVVGRCTLSDTDRIMSANCFRASRSDEEYFGNQCSKISKEDFCSFEEYDNKTLAHVDLEIRNVTKEECEIKCLNTAEFLCRGYSVTKGSTVCMLHSEDSKIRGPKLLLDKRGATYYEKAPCLNITVTCTDKNMLIRFKPKNKFDGRLYMSGHFDDALCYVKGQGTDTLMLNVALKTGNCGIAVAKDSTNSTLLYSTMIVQYNSLVQTQADRVVRIGCIYGNSTKVVVGTGVNFTTEFPGSVEALVNSTNSPHVTMRIVDASTEEELSETLLGQELELIIEADTGTGNDITASHLVAMSDNGQDSILLIDDRGCPTNLQIFPALTKTTTDNSTRLSAKFQAFKFSQSSIIRFSVIVQFCNGNCPTVDCGTYINKRSRRQANTSSVVKNLSRNSYEIYGKEMTEIPLHLNLTVKGDPTSDKYVYGATHQLIISDLEYGALCIDGYVLCILIILWIVVLIIMVACSFCIIRRYKAHYERKYIQMSMEEVNKNFGLGYSNLDNRRVRFASDTEYN